MSACFDRRLQREMLSERTGQRRCPRPVAHVAGALVEAFQRLVLFEAVDEQVQEGGVVGAFAVGHADILTLCRSDPRPSFVELRS